MKTQFYNIKIVYFKLTTKVENSAEDGVSFLWFFICHKLNQILLKEKK